MCFKYAKFRIERVNPFVWLVDTNNCSSTFWQLILQVTFLCYILRKKLCNPKCNHNMNWYVFRTGVLCFFHLSLVKTIVKSAKYIVVNMPSLWKIITVSQGWSAWMNKHFNKESLHCNKSLSFQESVLCYPSSV
jgi:hypothetical protein